MQVKWGQNSEHIALFRKLQY